MSSALAAARALPSARVRTALLRAGVGFAAAALLAVLFVRLVDIHSVFARVEHLSITFALLCGAAFLAAYVVRALRWRELLGTDVVTIPRATGIYFVAIFVNWLLPVRGGELVKSLLLRRSNGIPVARSLATVTADKALDLLPAIGLLAVLPLAHLRLGRLLWVLLLSALAVLAIVTVVLVLTVRARDRAVSWLSRGVGKVLPERFAERIEPWVVGFVDTLLGICRRPRLLAVTVGLTAVAVGLDALFCLLAFRAVGADVAFPVVLYGYTFYNLAYILPTPPGQIGSNEVIGLLIFSGVFGVGRSAVGAMFVFSHPWTAILMTAGGLLSLSAMGLTLRGALGLRRDAPAPAATATLDGEASQADGHQPAPTPELETWGYHLVVEGRAEEG